MVRHLISIHPVERHEDAQEKIAEGPQIDLIIKGHPYIRHAALKFRLIF